MKSSVASTLKNVADILKICSIVVMGISGFFFVVAVNAAPTIVPFLVMAFLCALASFVASFFMSGFSLVVEACFLYILEIGPKEADGLTKTVLKEEPKETALPESGN